MLAQIASDALLTDDNGALHVPAELGDALIARVMRLDEAVLAHELDGLRSFCDMMLGRGATDVASTVIDAVADALGARAKRKGPSTTEERRWSHAIGATTPTPPATTKPAKGMSLIAVRGEALKKH